jgi:dTDP-4-dehydrorhamnose 3,5-epimerase
MKFKETKIKGLYVAELDPFNDVRGFFVRTYCNKKFEEMNIRKPIMQINHSLTSEVGTIRGMHYQNPPFAEKKIVRCIAGEVFDVAIDIRKDSETFLQWHGEYLNAENFKMMVIPEGFAHGFQAIKPNSEMMYFHTNSYEHSAESGMLFNDQKIGINWPIKVTSVSDRDRRHKIITETFKGISSE